MMVETLHAVVAASTVMTARRHKDLACRAELKSANDSLVDVVNLQKKWSLSFTVDLVFGGVARWH
jgi:hypothetical protein